MLSGVSGSGSARAKNVTEADGDSGRVAPPLDLPPRHLESYLRESINFSLDAANLEGLELYFRECAAAGLIPRARPIEFAPTLHKEVAGRAQGSR